MSKLIHIDILLQGFLPVFIQDKEHLVLYEHIKPESIDIELDYYDSESVIFNFSTKIITKRMPWPITRELFNKLLSEQQIDPNLPEVKRVFGRDRARGKNTFYSAELNQETNIIEIFHDDKLHSQIELEYILDNFHAPDRVGVAYKTDDFLSPLALSKNTLKPHLFLTPLAFHPDRPHMAFVTSHQNPVTEEGNILRIWDIETQCIKQRKQLPNPDEITQMSYSLDGKYLILAVTDGSSYDGLDESPDEYFIGLRFLHADTLEEDFSIPYDKNDFIGGHFSHSPNGRYLATLFIPKTHTAPNSNVTPKPEHLDIWDLHQRKKIAHTSGVGLGFLVEWSLEGHYLATGSLEFTFYDDGARVDLGIIYRNRHPACLSQVHLWKFEP